MSTYKKTPLRTGFSGAVTDSELLGGRLAYAVTDSRRRGGRPAYG